MSNDREVSKQIGAGYIDTYMLNECKALGKYRGGSELSTVLYLLASALYNNLYKVGWQSVLTHDKLGVAKQDKHGEHLQSDS
jgi:hypothetical protein